MLILYFDIQIFIYDIIYFNDIDQICAISLYLIKYVSILLSYLMIFYTIDN